MPNNGFCEIVNFQFGPLLRILNLTRNNAFSRGVQMNTPLNTPNGTIVKIVSFLLSSRTVMDILIVKPCSGCRLFLCSLILFSLFFLIRVRYALEWFI